MPWQVVVPKTNKDRICGAVDNQTVLFIIKGRQWKFRFLAKFNSYTVQTRKLKGIR